VAEAEDGMIILGPDGRVSYANAAAGFLLGHGRGELVGEMFDLARAVADATTRVNVISRDGRVRLAELRVEPLPAGPSGSLVLRLKDVTSYDQDAANAREQVRRRDEFLAMLSHEVRNPLAAIRGAALLFARDNVDPETRRAAGDIFDRQFKHLGRILDELLDITRISRGKLEILKERVELAQAVHDALEEATPWSPGGGTGSRWGCRRARSGSRATRRGWSRSW
jgi:signal transduction histidine kinase